MPATLLQQYNPTITVNVKDYGAQGDGVTDDTIPVNAAIAVVKALGSGTVYFPAGNYLIPDGLVISSASNFTLRGDRGSAIWIGPNTTAFPARATHNVCTITDSTDFTIDGLTFDARKDTIAGNQYLTVTASSGQKNITVQDGTKYFVNTVISIYGGLTANGGTEKTFNEFNVTITGISGNVLTVNNNLSHTYTATGVSGGAYVTQYQTGISTSYIVAGRGLGNEDAQNGLHLISCQRFVVRNCVAQNTWESPIKMGVGTGVTTAVTDGCSHGIVTGNMSKHGYDQGISLWNCSFMTVTANKCEDAGWAGISFTHCNDSTATGNVCVNNYYSPATDINEGTGIAAEGGVRITINGNVCTANTSNGIRLGNSPMFRGDTNTTASNSAGDTVVVVGSNGAFQTGSSHTIIDPSNALIRETMYVASVSGNNITLSRALRNSYGSGAFITSRYGEDCLITGNICSQNVLQAGISAELQISLRIFSNDCSENGLNSTGTIFVDTQGTYGIHVQNHCEGAVIQANTCRMNAQEGILIDTNCNGVIALGNDVSSSGIAGHSSHHGIKAYGLVDGAILGNKVYYCNGDGIALENGGGNQMNHVQIHDNTCYYNGGAGMRLDNGGWGLTVKGNKCGYNHDVNIKVSGFRDSLFEGNQCFNSQGQEGIRFDDNGSYYCTDNKVFDNLLYSDNSSQSWGFRELNNSARTVLRGNRTYGNTNAAQISLSSTSRIAPDVALDSNTHDSTIIGAYNAIMPNADMQNATFNVWIDDVGNNLKFQVKYANGTVKNGSIALA